MDKSEINTHQDNLLAEANKRIAAESRRFRIKGIVAGVVIFLVAIGLIAAELYINRCG